MVAGAGQRGSDGHSGQGSGQADRGRAGVSRPDQGPPYPGDQSGGVRKVTGQGGDVTGPAGVRTAKQTRRTRACPPGLRLVHQGQIRRGVSGLLLRAGQRGAAIRGKANPNRSPAQRISLRRGARAHFRTRSLIGRRTVYLPNIDMTGFFKIHSRHTAMLFRRWRRYFLFLQISVFRFYTNTIYLHQVYRFLQRLLPRSYRLPPD